MLLRRGQELFPGVLAKDVRDRLRHARRHARFSASTIDDDALLLLLEDNGYIKQCDDFEGERLFDVTGKGAQLCAARVGSPLPRKKADALLEQVLDRAKTLNDAQGPIEIISILVFGSYLDDSVTQLGDLDLAIGTRQRPGSKLGTGIFRAHDGLMSKLRNRSPYLGLCGLGTVHDLGLTHRQVFPDRGPLVHGTGSASDP